MEGEWCIQDSPHLLIRGILLKIDPQYNFHGRQLSLLFEFTLIWCSVGVHTMIWQGEFQIA